MSPALHHGGNLLAAAQTYAIPVSDWLDLSTGVNPAGYPANNISFEAWNRLPQTNDGLEQAARSYYNWHHLLPVAGSQAAIMALPQLKLANINLSGTASLNLSNGSTQPLHQIKVLMPELGYKEHFKAWFNAGFSIDLYQHIPSERQIDACDVLLVINPNNPAGWFYLPEQLLEWHRRLAEKGGWLIVDEAFIDCTPQYSLSHHTAQTIPDSLHTPDNSNTVDNLYAQNAIQDSPQKRAPKYAQKSLDGLIILRSLGKFFGLAGARVGFVLAWPKLLDAMQNLLGPWSISGPAREIAKQALSDTAWQQQNRGNLAASSKQLEHLLQHYFETEISGPSLFKTVELNNASELHIALCHQGILTRLTDEKHAVRFGLPANDQQFQRLSNALKTLCI